MGGLWPDESARRHFAYADHRNAAHYTHRVWADICRAHCGRCIPAGEVCPAGGSGVRETSMDLNTLWFILIGVLFTGFFVLEGFDFGVGMLLPFLGKDDVRRRVMLN